MSVYRPTKICKKTGERIFASRFFWIDKIIQLANGERYRLHRSSGLEDEAAAIKLEAKLVQKIIIEGPPQKTPPAFTMLDAAWKYWEEVGQHSRKPKDTAKNIEHCKRLFGAAKPFNEIRAADIADVMRRRAGEDNGRGQPVALSSVNRQILDTFRAMWRRAARVWQIEGLPPEPDWKAIAFKTPKGRQRILTDEEAEIFWPAMREDYLPFLTFGAGRGLRMGEYLFNRSQIDLPGRLVTFRVGKKGSGWNYFTEAITEAEAALLDAEMKRAPGEKVFTYEIQRGPKKGMRAPITYEGFKSEIYRKLDKLRKAHPGLFQDLRFHDIRHDFATRYLRHTKDLQGLSQLMHHSTIRMTQRYVHMAGHERRAALEDFHSGYAPSRTRPQPGQGQGKADQKNTGTTEG